MSQEPSKTPGADRGEGDFSSAEIDALLKSAAERGGAESAAAVGAIQQDDIDALLKAGGVSADAAPGSEHEPGMDPTSARRPAAGGTGPGGTARVSLESYEWEPIAGVNGTSVDPKRVTMLGDVNLRVKVQLGQTRMLVEDVLKLGEGSVVELDKLAGDPVDILVNDRLIARGEVLVLNDNFCVRVSEVLSNNPHRVTM